MKRFIFLSVVLFFVVVSSIDAVKRRNSPRSGTSDDHSESQPIRSTKQPILTYKTKKPESRHTEDQRPSAPSKRDEDNTIEDVDEDKIDEILRDATKNLVIFFYDGRAKCPECADALAEVEEIDDDIEATGYIEVVKTDDRSVARELGVSTFPSLVYFRRKNPITYDGEFKDSEVVLRWVRSHEEVVTRDLTDDNFESYTNSYSPDEGTLDWFVMFYSADEPSCNAFVSSWETVAHRLRGLVNVGKVDSSVNDDVTERFRLDDDPCPVFLLFHRGKMYRYKDPAKDIRSLTNFALHKFKDQRGHRVPPPPTAIEQFYEHVKEGIMDALDDGQTLTVIGVGGLILIVATTLILKARRIQQQANGTEKSKTT
ncbi:hypothetical protein AB6A40_005032 [Gnathostoma spinigerum]|uniref:Thioredoxin domain-containing protein n=1 Tax=Gnathostoma spinigerum TaxID=75299 RepID=A0ABD6EEA3_9BILA